MSQQRLGPPGPQLSSSGEPERKAVIARRVVGSICCSLCSVSDSLSHSTLSIKWEVYFSKELSPIVFIVLNMFLHASAYEYATTKTIQVRRTRYAGLCWRSKDELISDVFLWTPSHGRAKAAQPARIYIQQLCADTGCSLKYLSEAMDDREGWRRGSGRSVMMVRHGDEIVYVLNLKKNCLVSITRMNSSILLSI